jgi:acetyl-CoA C-acetyltransferase
MVQPPVASVIGVGCTTFGDVLSTPEIQDKTLQELYVDACQEALRDAGLNPVRDIDAFFIGNYLPQSVHQLSVNSQACDWLGLQGKPSLNFATACSTTNVGLGLSSMAVMSGKYRCVLVTAGEILRSQPKESWTTLASSPLEREPLDPGEMFYYTMYGADTVYDNYGAASGFAYYGPWQMIEYGRRYGYSAEDIDRIEYTIRRNDRLHASLNPKSLIRESYEHEAKQAGYDNPFEYWLQTNPVSAWPVRVKSFLNPCDGASAYVICHPDLATELTDKRPVDLVGWGWSTTNSPFFEDPLEYTGHKRAYDEAYAMAGVAGADLDYLTTHSCSATMAEIESAETGGYFDHGEAGKAILDGRTLYTGDKPMNVTGGRHAFGHAWSASAGAELYEIVKQMRGEADGRQMAKDIGLAGIQNEGALFHTAVSILNRR